MSTEPKYIFYCNTTEGYLIKSLTELLQNTIKNGCFMIGKNGIKLRQTDSNMQLLIDLNLEASYFTQYKFNKNAPFSIGLYMPHLYKMVRNVKKKDSIILFIDEKKDTELGITVIPKEKNRVTTSYVKIQNLQSLDIDLPEGYTEPINIQSNEYSKMIKDLSSLGGSTINISSTKESIKFSCNANNIFLREIVFGEPIKTKILHSQDFETSILLRAQKISSLNTQLQFFQEKDKAFLFRSNIGILGKISIYVKDKDQVLNENIEDEDSD